MARSCRKLLSVGVLIAARAAAAAQPAPERAPEAPLPALGTQPITLDAASTQVDLPTRSTVFSKVTITQGTLRVQADRARATDPGDFANTRWTFDGHVKMDAEQRGSLRSDEAVVEFRNNQIARATVTGKPAEFEQSGPDAQHSAHGHADEIVYDVSQGTIRLTNDAWLSDGQNEISGPLIVYDIRAQRVQAATSPDTDQRVHIVITPHSTSPAGKTEAPRPQPDPQQPNPQP